MGMGGAENGFAANSTEFVKSVDDANNGTGSQTQVFGNALSVIGSVGDLAKSSNPVVNGAAAVATAGGLALGYKQDQDAYESAVRAGDSVAQTTTGLKLVADASTLVQLAAPIIGIAFPETKPAMTALSEAAGEIGGNAGLASVANGLVDPWTSFCNGFNGPLLQGALEEDQEWQMFIGPQTFNIFSPNNTNDYFIQASATNTSSQPLSSQTSSPSWETNVLPSGAVIAVNTDESDAYFGTQIYMTPGIGSGGAISGTAIIPTSSGVVVQGTSGSQYSVAGATAVNFAPSGNIVATFPQGDVNLDAHTGAVSNQGAISAPIGDSNVSIITPSSGTTFAVVATTDAGASSSNNVISARATRTIILPREWLNAITVRKSASVDLRFELRNASIKYHRFDIAGPVQRKGSLAQRYELLFEILLTGAPRFLKWYALFGFIAAASAILYGVYAVGVIMLRTHVQEGWFSTAIVQAASISFIGGGMSIVSIALVALLELLGGGNARIIVDEISNTNFFGKVTDLNVEVSSGDEVQGG